MNKNNKIWKIGTSIYSYINKVYNLNLWSQKIIYIKTDNGHSRIILDGRDILSSDSSSTKSQRIRVWLYLGIIKISNNININDDNNQEYQFINEIYLKDTIMKFVNKGINIIINENKKNDSKIFNNFNKFWFSICAILYYCFENGEIDNINYFSSNNYDHKDIIKASKYYKEFIDKFIYENSNSKDIIQKIKNNFNYLNEKEKILVKSEQNKMNEKLEEIKLTNELNQNANNSYENTFDANNIKWEQENDEKSSCFDTKIQNLMGILSIITNTPDHEIKIPIYQRKYKWSKDIFRQLLIDIYEISNNKRYHSIGSLTFNKNKNLQIKEIVDGQQRLTSMIIIVYSLYQYCKEKNLKIPSLLERFIRKNKNKNIIFHRISGNKDYDDMNAIYKGDLDYFKNNKGPIYENFNLARIFFNEKKINSNNIIELWKKILINTVFFEIEYKNYSSFLTFERLNTCSEPLKPLELFKNYLLNDLELKKIYLNDKDEENFQKVFEDKILKLFEIKGLGSKAKDKLFDKYINCMIRYYDLDLPKDYDNYYAIKTLYKTKYKNKVNIWDKNTYKNIIENISKDICEYLEITQESLFKQRNAKYKLFADYLWNFKSRDVYSPLIMKILHHYGFKYKEINNINIINDIRKLIHVIEIYEVRLKICNYKGQSLSNEITKIIKWIDEQDDDKLSPNELLGVISYKLKGGASLIDNETFYNKLFLNSLSSDNAKIILNRIENFLYHKGVSLEDLDSKIKIIDMVKPTLEHIIPQSFENYFDNIDNEYYNEIKNKMDFLGNALIIEFRKNSKASNKKWVQKWESYNKDGEIKNLLTFQGCKINNDIILSPIKKEKFELNSLKIRHEELCKIAKIIWSDNSFDY